MRIPTLARSAYVALSVTDTWLSGRPPSRWARWITKPLLMPSLGLALATDPRAYGSPLRVSTLAGLAASGVGDIALLGHGSRVFVVGAGAFGVGHLAYTAGFAAHGAPGLTSAPVPRLVAAQCLVSGVTLSLAARRQDPSLSAPVLVYCLVIGAMTAQAAHLDPRLPVGSRRATAVGAACFVLSDTLLAVRKFVMPEPTPAMERAVMATYTLAQALIVEGAARAGQRPSP